MRRRRGIARRRHLLAVQMCARRRLVRQLYRLADEAYLRVAAEETSRENAQAAFLHAVYHGPEPIGVFNPVKMGYVH